MRSKRGQFYLFAMIILCSLVFLAISGSSVLTAGNEKYDRISQNYITESTYVLNDAVFEGKNITEQFRAYTEEFINYAGIKSVKFTVLYILTNNNTITMGNYLTKTVQVYETGESILPGEEKTMPYMEDLTLNMEGQFFTYTVTPNNVQLKALMNVEGK